MSYRRVLPFLQDGCDRTQAKAHWIAERSITMMPSYSSRRIFFLVSLLWSAAVAYQRPHCSGWPTDAEWASFEANLTPNAALHGPFRNGIDYVRNCYLANQERVLLLDQGQGLCLSRHDCLHDACAPSRALALPAYTVEASTTADVQQAVRFAAEHDLPLAVKSSGHSFEGQSMADDALLIWMRHFEQTNVVHTVQDTCGDSYTTVQVAGGQNFDDTFLHIKNDHHIASGTCQTVVLGGGWTLGGGVSWTSRMYGYGVDNVVSMEVVLADGTVVTADACNAYSDLFWALRGGGGGNFGIVTQMEYIVHPPTKIVVLEFDYENFFTSREREFATKWMELLIAETPTLERRWGGAWNPLGARFMFSGSIEDALASPWMAQVDAFYDSVANLEPNFARPSTLLEEFDGFHDQNGGDESHANPDFDASARTEPSWYRDSFSRVLPVELLQEKPTELRDLIVDMWFRGETTHPQNYIFGGRTMDTDPTATAIHPAMRRGVLEFRVRNQRGADRLAELLEGYTWSVCYNHHSVNEPNYEEACWGDNYPRLQEIKTKYDPDHRFNVFHGVNYQSDVESDGCRRRRQYGVVTNGLFFSRFGLSAVEDVLGNMLDVVVSLFSGLF